MNTKSENGVKIIIYICFKRMKLTSLINFSKLLVQVKSNLVTQLHKTKGMNDETTKNHKF